MKNEYKMIKLDEYPWVREIFGIKNDTVYAVLRLVDGGITCTTVTDRFDASKQAVFFNSLDGPVEIYLKNFWR